MKKILITGGPTEIPMDIVRIMIPWYEMSAKNFWLMLKTAWLNIELFFSRLSGECKINMAITNIFTGATSAAIAKYFAEQGDSVTLVTSKPKSLKEEHDNIRIVRYKTYHDLAKIMQQEITHNKYDAIIHSAAVSDYQSDGVYVADEGNRITQIDSSSKISSQHDALYVKLIPTEKLVDKIRNPWGFQGILVKFKLQDGISDKQLIEIAKKSRATSAADMIVANCREWANYYAYIIDKQNNAEKVHRRRLAQALYERIDAL